MRVLVRTLLGAVILGATGCYVGGATIDYQGHLRARLANEFGCPVQAIAVTELGGPVYRVNNCGPVATYVCDYNRGSNSVMCLRESVEAAAPRPAPVPVARPAVQTRGDPAAEAQLRVALDSRRDAILACAPGISTVVIRGEFTPSGTVLISCAPPLAATPEEACIRAALQGLVIQSRSPGVVLHPVTIPFQGPPPTTTL